MQPNLPSDGNPSHIRRPLGGPSDDPRSYEGQLPEADPRPYGGPLIASHIPTRSQARAGRPNGSKTATLVTLGVVALLFGGCAVAVGLAVSSKPTAEISRPPENPATKGAKLGAGAGAAPSVKPHVVLRVKGNGMKNTREFTVHGNWDLIYRYDCKLNGGTGYFGVSGPGALGDQYVNESGAMASDTTHQHDGPGKMSLVVNATCPWSIKVMQLP